MLLFFHRYLFSSLCLVTILLGGSAHAGTDTGRLLRIDPRTGTLTLTKGRPYVTYHFRDTVEVSLNGQPAKVAQLVPGLQVRIETNEPGIANRIQADGQLQIITPPTSPKQSSEGLINLNTATPAELDDLPGVGPVLVEAIIRGRPFSSVGDLGRVKGIGPQTLKKLAPFVKVN